MEELVGRERSLYYDHYPDKHRFPCASKEIWPSDIKADDQREGDAGRSLYTASTCVCVCVRVCVCGCVCVPETHSLCVLN